MTNTTERMDRPFSYLRQARRHALHTLEELEGALELDNLPESIRPEIEQLAKSSREMLDGTDAMYQRVIAHFTGKEKYSAQPDGDDAQNKKTE